MKWRGREAHSVALIKLLLLYQRDREYCNGM
jgi:hypothetical protein